MSTIDDQTRDEWRSLGFYYEFDEVVRKWRIRGSQLGLGRLCAELRRYAADAQNNAISEHEHYGPYSSLKFVTWTEPKIIGDGVYGRIDDFKLLADLVEKAIGSATIGTHINIDSAYSQKNEATLELVLEADVFDPALADPALNK